MRVTDKGIAFYTNTVVQVGRDLMRSLSLTPCSQSG